MRQPLSDSIHYYQPKSSNKCLGCCRLSLPLLYEHSKPEGWLSSLDCEAMDIAGEASGKPWMFDLDCTLLMKPNISQLKAASTPSSPCAPSYLPTPFLCILILCVSEECGKCEFFRLPYYGHYRTLHYHHCRRNFVALQFKCSHFKTGSRGSEDHDQVTPPAL